ncbi:MAG: IgGFc-binding protein [Dysgonamonadaceae bacterium]|jgi:hypothetical protein|nr:IgGFc-binding protein [Dysgonamonadaceae bacterium]
MKRKTMKNFRQLKTLFCALLALLIGANAQAQSMEGVDFWVSYGSRYEDDGSLKPSSGGTFFYRLKMVTGDQSATVTLSFTDNPSLNTTLNIAAHTIQSYELTPAQRNVVYNEATAANSYAGVSSRSLHITSTAPIIVYTIDQASASTDATNLMPSTAWGQDYYHISYRAFGNNRDGYIVIAKDNGTAIFVNGTQVATLDAGQVYQYKASATATDETGHYHIQTNQPVAYFVSNSGIRVPITAQFSDISFLQLPPLPQWGMRFIVPNTIQQIGRVRVFAASDGTVVSQIGATLLSSPGIGSLNLNAGQFAELEITGGNGCYITANNQVAVTAYMVCANYSQAPASTDKGDPAETWIPPVGQMLSSVMMAPFFSGSATQLRYHYALVMTPTANRDATTVSIAGAAPVPVASSITWQEIAGSNYSFGSMLLADKIYEFFSSDSLLVAGYGVGSAESYYYVAGAATRDLSHTYTVNTIDYIDFDGTSLCTDAIAIQATFIGNILPSTVEWWLNGSELTTYRNQSSWSTTLADGNYTLEMRTPSGAGMKSQETHFSIGKGAVIWTPAANTAGTDADRQNWDDHNNWTPAIVPSKCTDVYVPGNCDYYPSLTAAAACRNIYFIQGAELGRPDYLDYDSAFVHLNFGLLKTTQATEASPAALQNLVLNSSSASDRMKFSASTSAKLNREQWYMFSAPLRDMLSGDFGMGAAPLTFMRKFGPITKDGTNYTVGNWTNEYTSYVEPVAATEGFAYYMYGYDPAGTGNRNRGTDEQGSFNTLNDLTYLPASRAGHTFGIQNTNGILEFPFLANNTLLEAHRTQVYTPASRTSTFYYFTENSGTYPIDGAKAADTYVREANGSANRFITETYGTKWTFTNPVTHSIAGLNDGDEFLVGNPYMSSIDAVEFVNDNAGIINPSFRTWNGTTFVSYSVSGTTVTPSAPVGDSRYIAPMQGFMLTKGATAGDVKFDVTKISKTRPTGTASTLRNANENTESNTIRIQAENDGNSSYLAIVQRDNASNNFREDEDVRKLFTPYTEVPEIYALARDIPVDINFINNLSETTIPLGLRTQQTGTITFTFTGMDRYMQGGKIIFEDALENKAVDLTGKSSYTYSFDNQTKGIQNGRFFLRLAAMPTYIQTASPGEDIKVIAGASGITIYSQTNDPVRKITVFDLQGQKLYESRENGNGRTVVIPAGSFDARQVIVRIVTDKQTRNVKLNNF